jgi:2-polyprenyl-3-methyl-5-hydroxy-6-metoxy-1,4-benzoquinol methylase
MNFDALSNLGNKMPHPGYVEYIFYKSKDNKSAVFENLENHNKWQYPECWKARHWLNYVQHGNLLKNKKILEIGSNFNFQSVCSIQAGADSVHGLEPHEERFNLGNEYVTLKNMSHQIKNSNISFEDYMEHYDGKQYDVLFFQDVLYYLQNPLKAMRFIKKYLKPKIIFLESTVVDDINSAGHLQIILENFVDTFESQIWQKDEGIISLCPSRNALRNIINSHGWKILTYYDYKDFIGHGESSPRKNGKKDYYVLESIDE